MEPRKRILLGLTGGVAAFKCAELTRLLIQDGWDVQVVMTEAATRFITPITMQALSGKPVFTSMWEGGVDNGMAHIELSRDRDLIVVAPATANFVAKLAHGTADDLLSTLCLARECPLMVAPAMNRQMWENPATQRNVEQLRKDGVFVSGPAAGAQACGEVGEGRMLEARELAQEVVRVLTPQTLAGKRVLLTAGPTFEPIDPVRGITNRSSGRMGYALAQAAREAGAEVTVVSGPSTLEAPFGIEITDVTTSAQMLEAVRACIDSTDIFISVAAVADYRPAQSTAQKIKKGTQTLSMALEPTVDILASVAGSPGAPFCVGFAAESEKLDNYAEEKRRRKGLPLLIGNIAQHAIGAEMSEVVLYDDAGRHPLPKRPKLENARKIIQHISRMLRDAPGRVR